MRLRPPRVVIGLACGLVAVLAHGVGSAQAIPALDDLLCLHAKPASRIDRSLRFTPQTGLTLRNRALGELVKIDARKSLGLCLPAHVDGGPVEHAATSFESYGARLSRTKPAQAKPSFDLQRVTNRFGIEELRLKALSDVMVQSAAVLDPPPLPASVPTAADDFACWDAERTSGVRGRPAAPAPLTVESDLGTWKVDVKAPTRVCFPSDLAGADPAAPSHVQVLACYRAQLTRTKPPQEKPFPREVATTNRFGSEQLALTTTLDLCVASYAIGVSATPTPAATRTPTPTPTLTPPPDFVLKVEPKVHTIDIGVSHHFAAMAYYKNGNVVDFTERVLWRSSTGAIVMLNLPGERGRIDAVDGGSAVISVLDEQTGVSSTDTGDDSIVTVNWTLQRIELLPVTATRGKGESIRLRATGHFASGYTRSIAERLVYAASNPSILLPTNDPDPANRSRVVAQKVGTASISATDPLSGVTSTSSNDDVTITVVPPMESCFVAYDTIGLIVGGYYQFTTTGSYPGGFQRNITQQVQYATDNPAVVTAPNADGDRSRVVAVAPGEGHITVTDPVTGVVCSTHPLVRVGVPSSLFLQPPDPLAWFPKRAGRSWHAIAIEKYTPPTAKDYVTEDVVFTSSDPSIVAAPNIAGDRGRLDAVGSGTAYVGATDPRNGFVSQTIALRSLAGLTRVSLGPTYVYPEGFTSIVDVGRTFEISAIGQFGDGPATLEPTDLMFVSDNPAVAEVTFTPPRYWRVHTLAPGVATISATDIPTGISSDAFGQSLRLGVRGPVERITLVPPTVTRRAGEAQPFAAVVHYVGGASEIGTQKLVYSSSDPNVAVATNDFYVRGRVNAIAGGTATITATDPATGVTSDDSGESAVLTVVGPLARIRIQPDHVTRSILRSFSFTAIGYDAAGRSTNVTQDVTWSSSDPDVAVALNPEGNRSRIDARYKQATTMISASDPETGVRSTDSGEDAGFEVKGYLTALILSTTRSVLTVGETIQLTATGQLNYRDEVNLTQEVEYTSSNPSVVRADNAPGDKSRVTALKPGQAYITARDPVTGIVTSTNARVTLVVTGP